MQAGLDARRRIGSYRVWVLGAILVVGFWGFKGFRIESLGFRVLSWEVPFRVLIAYPDGLYPQRCLGYSQARGFCTILAKGFSVSALDSWYVERSEHMVP